MRQPLSMRSFLPFLVLCLWGAAWGAKPEVKVSFDHRAFVIDGERTLFIAGQAGHHVSSVGLGCVMWSNDGLTWPCRFRALSSRVFERVASNHRVSQREVS